MREYVQSTVPLSGNVDLPGAFPALPDDVKNRFKSMDDYGEEIDQWWRKAKIAILDSTEDVSRAVTENTTALVNLKSSVAGNTAAITNEAIARATADYAMAATIAALSVSAGSGALIFVQGTAPTATHPHDLWYDTSGGGFIPKYWTGTAWVSARDSALTTAMADIAVSQANITTILSTYATTTFAEAKKTEAIAAAGLYTDGQVGTRATIAALNAETSARTSADTAETNARTTAIAAINGQINFWTPVLSNVTDNGGGSFSKSGGTPGSWDGQVYSTESYKGGACVSWSPNQTNANVIVGLNTDPTTSAYYADIDYSLQMASDGNFGAWESGVLRGVFGAYATTDRFSIIYDGAFVRYFKNGTLLREVAAAADLVLFLDTSFADPGARLNKLRFGPADQAAFTAKALISSEASTRAAADAAEATVRQNLEAKFYVSADVWTPAWTPGNIATYNDGTFSKVAGSGAAWDSQVYSVEGYKGGAVASFRPHTSAQYILVGLNSDPTTDADYASIDYAFHLHSSSTIYIFESGVNLGSFGTYAAGDIFQVVYDNSSVRYFRNGTLLREVTVSAGLTLYFDSSFLSIGSQIDSTRYEKYSGAAYNAVALVSTESSARATADGFLSGKYSIKVTAGNRVTGMNLTSASGPGTDISDISFIASSFKVYNNTTDVAPFQIVGSKIRFTGNVEIDGALVLSGTLSLTDLSNKSLANLDSTANTKLAGIAAGADVTLSAVNGGLTVTGGGITLSAGGAIKGGATDFGTGIGFFLGYESAQYKFRVGNPAGNYVSWDGSTMTVRGTLNADDLIAGTVNVARLPSSVTSPAVLLGHIVGGGSTTSGTYTECGTMHFSVDANAAQRSIRFAGTVTNGGGSSTTYNVAVFRDGTQIYEFGNFTLGAGGTRDIAFSYAETPGAGTYVYTIKGKVVSGSATFVISGYLDVY